MNESTSQPFARWRIVVGCFLGVVMAAGFNGSFSVFLVPVTKEFGWGRAVLSQAFFVSTIVSAMCYPLFGKLLDRFGTRRVLFPTLILHGVSIMALSLTNESQIELYMLYIFFGVGGSMSGYIAYARLVSGWFPARRGLALGLTLGAGTAIGSTIQPQVARLAIDLVGWRDAYIVLGLPFFLFALPNLLLLADPPRLAKAARDGVASAVAAAGLTGAEARRTATFWMVIAAILLFVIGWEGPRGHLVALMTDRGYGAAFGTLLLSTIALSSSVGRVIEGFLLDRIQTPKIGIPPFALVLVGILILHHGTSTTQMLIAAVVIGVGVGAEHSLLAYFASRYFGMRAYAEIYAFMLATSIMSIGAGPLLMGRVFDQKGSYDSAFVISELMIAGSIVLIALLKRYRYDLQDQKARPDAGPTSAKAGPEPK